MDIIYRLQGLEFEWDESKARRNVEKHGITFEKAAEAFFDPFYQTGDASVNDEQRDFIRLFAGPTSPTANLHGTR